MSRQIVIAVGAALLVLVVVGALFQTQNPSRASAMTGGPGMLYFYSED